MTRQPLQELFEAMYHGKLSFDDFLHSPMAQNYTLVSPGSEGAARIVKPADNLKTYQKFLNLFLFEFLPVNERVVFSYRKGFSAINAVEKHTNAKYFFQTDISSFFASIDSSLARNVILSGADHCPISDIHHYIDRIIELICLEDSLPIGFLSSAPLSNSVLFHFDNRMEIICEKLGLVYSRYADDIIISASKLSELLKVEKIVQENLHAYASPNFLLNQAKTRFFNAGNKVKILGMMILPNGKISPDTKKREEIEILLYLFVTDRARFNDRVLELRRKRLKKNVDLNADECSAILSGNLNYIDSIDPQYTNKLRRKFGAATIDMLIHHGFSKKK